MKLRLLMSVILLLCFVANIFAKYKPTNSKSNVVVLDFKLLTKGSLSLDQVSVLSSKFRSAIIKTNKFKVLDRDNVNEILIENNFSLQDFASCSGGQCAIELGKLVSAEKIIFGDIGKLGETYSITVKIISAETGAVEDKATVSEKHRGSIDGLIDISGIMAQKLAGTYKKSKKWWYVAGGAIIGGLSYFIINEQKADKTESSLPQPPSP